MTAMAMVIQALDQESGLHWDWGATFFVVVPVCLIYSGVLSILNKLDQRQEQEKE